MKLWSKTIGRTKDGPHGAFSLVEVLVVVSCLAVVFAAAGPSLHAVRKKSKQSVCLQRLRAIGTASRFYATNDPKDEGIPVHEKQGELKARDPLTFGPFEWGGKSGIGRPGFVPGPSGSDFYLTSQYGTLAGFGPASRPLNKILYPSGLRDHRNPTFDRPGARLDTRLELDAYRCPADDGPPGGIHCVDWLDHPERSSYDHFGNSYAANAFLITTVAGGWILSNSPYMRALARVPAPARTILYEENIGRKAWVSRRTPDYCMDVVGRGTDPGPTKAIRGWHGKNWRFNNVFTDLHAEQVAVFIEGTGDQEGYFEHFRREVVFPDDPDKDERFRCVIVRGDGWQRDTLPAEPVSTGAYWDPFDYIPRCGFGSGLRAGGTSDADGDSFIPYAW